MGDGAHAIAVAPTTRRAVCLAARPDASAFSAWVRAGAAGVDWAAVLATAERHKLAALVAARMAAAGVEAALPAALRRHAFRARVEGAERAARAQRTLVAVAAAFDGDRLPFFVVKGSVLAHRVYQAPHLRRFADVDVVVRRADVARAEARLTALGYRAGGAEGLLAIRLAGGAERARALDLTRRFERRHAAAHTWHAPPSGEGLSIDLHWHVVPARLRVDQAALWEQTVAVDLAGTTVRTFTPAATVIHLAAHATTCLLNGFRLLHLVDVGWAATRFADQAEATWRLARQWRVAADLAQVLAMAERLLETELPLAAGRGAVRPARRWADALLTDRFLFGAATLAQRHLAARAWRELAWSVAMGCVRRNLAIAGAAALARARFRAFRRRPGGQK